MSLLLVGCLLNVIPQVLQGSDRTNATYLQNQVEALESHVRDMQLDFDGLLDVHRREAAWLEGEVRKIVPRAVHTLSCYQEALMCAAAEEWEALAAGL
jgi:hypothetical protein